MNIFRFTMNFHEMQDSGEQKNITGTKEIDSTSYNNGFAIIF